MKRKMAILHKSSKMLLERISVDTRTSLDAQVSVQVIQSWQGRSFSRSVLSVTSGFSIRTPPPNRASREPDGSPSIVEEPKKP